MFFNFFKKKEKKEEDRPKLKIYDENGEEIIVDRKEWVDTFLNPKIEENFSKPDILYNVILVALNYKVYDEVLNAALRLRDLEFNSKRSMEVLLEIYYNSNAYNEIVELVDEYKEKMYEMSPNIYYYYFISQKKINLDLEYEDSIYEAIYNYPNNKKIVEEFKILLNKKNIELKNKLMESVSNIKGAYTLCLYFAELEYEANNYNQANKYILKSLSHSNYKIDAIKQATNLLFKYHQYTEFENYILSRFNIKDKNVEYCYLMLEYYYIMLKYKDGLELLTKMYHNEIYEKNNLYKLVSYENKFLDIQFRKENVIKYEAIEKGQNMGNVDYFNILNPIYFYVLNRDKSLIIPKNNDMNIMVLPFYAKNINLSEEDKNYLSSLSICLLEKIYNKTDIKIQVSYKKDDISILLQEDEYNQEFFDIIKENSPNLTYLISGEVKELNGEKFLEIFRYDFENKKKTIMVVLTNIKDKEAIVYKFIDSILDYFRVHTKINLLPNELENTYSRLELFFDFKDNNKYKNWNLFYLLNYYIDNAKDSSSILNALSIIQFMKIYGVFYFNKYRNILYDLNVRLENDTRVRNLINNIFERSEENV